MSLEVNTNSSAELDVHRKGKCSGCQIWKNIDATFDSRLDEAMKTKPLFLAGCIALLSFAFAGTASAADTKIEQALRDADAQWSAAA